MTTPPNAPEVDVLSVIDELINVPVIECTEDQQFIGEAKRMRAAVEALLTREAALVAERDALKDERDQLNSDYLTAINAAKVIAAERDALAAVVGALRELADKWERIGREHGVRQFTGNDHLMFANELRAVIARAEAGHG